MSCVGDLHALNTVERINIDLSGTGCGFHAQK